MKAVLFAEDEIMQVMSYEICGKVFIVVWLPVHSLKDVLRIYLFLSLF
jgi:hypothetical protein